MKVLIVEDEMMARSNLARILRENHPDMEIAGMTGSVRDTVAWLNDSGNEADVIFMDVELSDGNCFSIFDQTDIRAKVIMTTAYDTYAVKAFEAGSVDYLLKPVDLQSLDRAVARCRTSVASVDLASLMKALGRPAKEYKERIIVRFNDRIIPVKTSDIAYFYSEEKSNFLVTFSNDTYIVDGSMDCISEGLDPVDFFRISRSCILSLPAIVSIVKQAGGRLKVISRPQPSFEMTVSRSRADDFLKWLEK